MKNTQDQIGMGVCLALTHAIGRARNVDAIYEIALQTLADALDASRSAVLLFDENATMRFVAARGLSQGYQRAVEGHSPWAPDTADPLPIVVGDIEAEPTLAPYPLSCATNASRRSPSCPWSAIRG